MEVKGSQSVLAESLIRAGQHWQARHQAELAAKGQAPDMTSPPTIALSREVGALGTTVARAVGERLGWPVYDHELLEKIAQEMNLRVRLLESVDERRMSWIEECIESFGLKPQLSENAYVRHLVQTLFSLAAHGECVIVGRGAPLILPLPTTLRVRLVAPLDFRLGVVMREQGMSRDEALRYIHQKTRERVKFNKDHFQKDLTEPEHFDLLLNSSRFSVAECADLILAALRNLEKQLSERRHRTSP